MSKHLLALATGALLAVTVPAVASAANCPVTHDQLAQALRASVNRAAAQAMAGLTTTSGRRSLRATGRFAPSHSAAAKPMINGPAAVLLRRRKQTPRTHLV